MPLGRQAIKGRYPRLQRPRCLTYLPPLEERGVAQVDGQRGLCRGQYCRRGTALLGDHHLQAVSRAGVQLLAGAGHEPPQHLAQQSGVAGRLPGFKQPVREVQQHHVRVASRLRVGSAFRGWGSAAASQQQHESSKDRKGSGTAHEGWGRKT